MIHASERDTPQAAERRANWQAEIRTIPAERLVFVDETGTTLNMTSRYGRAPKGARVHGAVPGGRWETTTLLGAISLEGVRASMTVDSATDTDVFLSFVRRVLVPVLRPGDVVIWDNLAPHRSPVIAKAIQKAHAILRPLPPYSPDFNPIEQCWSKVKQRLRMVEARTRESLDQAVGQALQQVTVADAKGWFRHCGYSVTST